MARERGERILGWEPDTLFLTHFGPFNGARQHFHELMSRMDEWGRTARRLVLDERLTEEEREQQFVAEALLDLRRIVGVADAEQVQPRRKYCVFVARSGSLLAQAGVMTSFQLPVLSCRFPVPACSK